MSKKNIIKKESFFKGMFTVGVGSFINLLVSFFTTPVITRIVDPDELGQFSFFILYTSLALVVLYLGMDQALVRYYYHEDNIEYKRRLALESVVLPFCLTIVSALIFILIIKLGLIDIEFDAFCIFLLILNVIFSLLFRFSSLFVRLNHDNTLYARLQVLQKLLYVVAAICLLKVIKFNGLYSLSLSTVLAVMVCLIISLISQKEYIPNKKTKINNTEMKQMLWYGFPFVFSVGITTLFQSLDKIAIKHYGTFEDVGIYTSAMMFVSLFSVVQTSFNIVWAPKSIEHYSEKPDDKEFYKKAFDMVSGVMFFLGVSLILFKDLAALILGPKYRAAGYIMPFLMLEPIMYTISETTVCGVNFMKKSKLHVIIAFVSCLLNFIGNTILVPILGCKGAAISTGVSYIAFFVLRTYFGEKTYHIGFDLKKICLLTICIIAFAAYSSFYVFSFLHILFALFCYLLIILCYKKCICVAWEYCQKHILFKHRYKEVDQ